MRSRAQSALRHWVTLIALVVGSSAGLEPCIASQQVEQIPESTAVVQNRRLVELGPGDGIAIQVFGQPDMSTTVNIADDGTVSVPLVGNVPVRGLSPSEAAARIETALVEGKILVHPQVTVTLTTARSQRVSVLGEVGAPGRYPIESTTTIFDLLAQAGGAKDSGSDTVLLLRPDPDGTITRYSIDIKGLYDPAVTAPPVALRGGDTLLVPKAPQFYIFGEVTAPNMYKIEAGMTYLQAIARAGGVTVRGSQSRFEVKRKDAHGVEHVVKVKLSDLVQPNDVIRVKESIF